MEVANMMTVSDSRKTIENAIHSLQRSLEVLLLADGTVMDTPLAQNAATVQEAAEAIADEATFIELTESPRGILCALRVSLKRQLLHRKKLRRRTIFVTDRG
jgi:hypothetical protein